MAEQLPVFKKPKRDRNRFTLQFEAPLEESSRIEALKDRVKGCKLRWQVENNTEWLERVLDVVEMMQSSPASPLSQPSSPTPSPFLAPVTPPQVRYFSSRFSPGSSPIPSPSPPGSISSPVAVTPPSGQQRVEIHTPVEEDDGSYFVASTATVRRLLKSVTESNGNCPSCHGVLLLETTEMQRRVSVRCQRNHEVVWFSSPITNSKFLINLRMIHGFLSSGLTETQYRGFMEAASLGSVEHTYLDTVVNKLGYSASVTEMYENSLAQARMKVQRSADYMAQNGDVIITDARHDSSRSAQHTTVTAISYQNKRVIGTVNWSKKDLASAQSREVPMTKELIHQLEAKGGKAVKKRIQKVANGLKRDEGKTWFPELTDKVKATKTHFYYAMRNNDGTEEGFRKYLLNIIPHYQGDHTNCYEESRCHMSDYVCTKKPLETPQAIDAFRKALMDTAIYKKPSDYMTCRDTYWIETFHVVILIYAAKRINFGDDTYIMRVQLAALDWNENVDHEVSSLQFHQYARNPDRMAPIRILVPKTFEFRKKIWEIFLQSL
ncbi:uncharacterized protein LOC144649932 isoform X2 [Oculina patagonica]